MKVQITSFATCNLKKLFEKEMYKSWMEFFFSKSWILRFIALITAQSDLVGIFSFQRDPGSCPWHPTQSVLTKFVSTSKGGNFSWQVSMSQNSYQTPNQSPKYFHSKLYLNQIWNWWTWKLKVGPSVDNLIPGLL